MRRRLNYANVTATLALFFAMTGGAIAAKHYLINSTRQIKPSVLKALRGNRGPAGNAGAVGPSGPAGKEGAPGKQGPPGAFVATLPSGQTLRGTYAGRATGGVEQEMQIPISFGVTLPAAPSPHYVSFGEVPPPQCPGTAAEPNAAPGNLCIYESAEPKNATSI